MRKILQEKSEIYFTIHCILILVFVFEGVFFPGSQFDLLFTQQMKGYWCLGVLCFGVFLPVASVQVSDALQFIHLINNQTLGEWTDGQIVNDLDFSNITLGKPLGLQTDGKCISFRGIIQGNNHTIKGLKMKKNNGHAGLFCGLDDATIEDLIFDESCTFNGVVAGSLSVMASGNVRLESVVNHAKVSGSSFTGGLIGYIENASDATIAFVNSENFGTVTGKGNCTGGLVGSIQFIYKSDVVFYNEMNSGLIDGYTGVGGFLGCMISTSECMLMIDDSINHNKVIGGGALGGFIGLIQNNTEMDLFIGETINNSTVTAQVAKQKYQDGCGGFVGTITNNMNTNIIMNQCTNNQSVTGVVQISGFFGATQDLQQCNIYILNCMNKGNVASSFGQSCGFISSLQNEPDNTFIDIYNCKNEGNISGGKAYGIAPSVRNAINVVGMGFVTGSFSAYPLWKTSLTMESCFALNQTVENATTFSKCDLKCKFCIQGDPQTCVQDLLNTVSNSFQSDNFLQWDDELNLVEQETVPSSGSLIQSSLIVVLMLSALTLYPHFL